jgi:hypothetical protein
MANCQRQNEIGHGGVARPANRRVTVEDQQGQEQVMNLCPVCYHWGVKRDETLKVVKVEPLGED